MCKGCPFNINTDDKSGDDIDWSTLYGMEKSTAGQCGHYYSPFLDYKSI